MNIEIEFPNGQVKHWIIDHVRAQLIDLHHSFRDISKVRVLFKDFLNDGHDNKVCEITLQNGNDSLFFHTMSRSYEQAARTTLSELGARMAGHIMSTPFR